MSIKNLGKAVQSRLSAAAKTNSYTRAVEELVYNSLDSDSTSIAVRIDIHESLIQVIDNGSGISKNDIYLLGQRYTTSKAVDLSRSAVQVHPSKYGFRGESLANIIEVSNNVKITSRYERSDETWIKYFVKGQHRDSYLTTTRPSKGTTVEIKGFLYNLHIQKKETNNITEIQNIKKFLQQISLERTNISMSFRDNSRNEIIFTVHKNRDIYQTLYSFFEIDKKDVQELQVEKNQYKIKGFVGRNESSHNSYRWIYLNGRIVQKSVVNDIVNEYFMNNQAFNGQRLNKKRLQGAETIVKEIPYYFIFISCPKSDYDICFDPEKTFVQFTDWKQIKMLIEKFVHFFNGDIRLKEISVKKTKQKLGSTQEEARKIVEKILGNKNKIQMDKGVIGKTVRKIIKQNNNNTNLQKKTHSIEASNKNHKYKESALAESCNIKENINLSDKVNNNRIEKIQKFSHSQRIHKKIKKSETKKNKCSPCSNLIIKKFSNPTDSVKQRCELFSEYVKELLNKKIKSANENAKHAKISEDKIKLEGNVTKAVFKKKENESSGYRNAKFTKGNSNGALSIVPLGKTDKDYLRSYDLLKTILNTQKDVSCFKNVSPQTTSAICRHVEKNNSNKIIDVTNAKSNTSSSFTDLTFNSHKNLNKNSLVSRIKHRRRTDNNLYKFSVRKEIAQSICHTKYKQSMLKKYSLEKNNENNRRENINRDCSKLKNIFNIAGQKSYNIDIRYTDNNKPDFIKSDNKLIHDNWNLKVTGNIQSTYTVIDSNVSLNFENCINRTTTISECYEKSIAIEKESYFGKFNHHSDRESICDHTYNIYSRATNEECNSKTLFTSRTDNFDSQKNTNSHIEPLSVCEAVYKNDNESNIHISNGNTFSNTSKDSKSICPNSRRILETYNKVNDDDMLPHNVDDKSHHFANINNSKIVPSQINNWYSNITKNKTNNVNTSKKETEINPIENDTNNKYSLESLDVYFKTTPDWGEVITRNENINNFILQNRHNFLPKGMSQIFENCNTKRVCSYDLEMDYFQDELYNDFANNVLDNFTLFESRIQNVKDNVPENNANLNKKLKTDDSKSLKFNTHSLRSAKVFGQVDNKYIATELRNDNDNSLKYLVLFDQHAVHERISLEENLTDYIKNDQWISVDCEILAIKLNKEKIIYLNNYKDKFTQLGLKWTFENDLVLINGIPKAILGKHCRQNDVILTCIKNVITEEIKAIKSLKGNSLLYPKSIMELVFSEACRYAIKFGDVLTKDKCAMLIEFLSTCKTPFQCAHGRPVMAVLLDMKTIDNKYMVNMSKVLMFRNKVTK